MKLKVWITDEGNCDVLPDEWPAGMPADGLFDLNGPTDISDAFGDFLVDCIIDKGFTVHMCKEDA